VESVRVPQTQNAKFKTQNKYKDPNVKPQKLSDVNHIEIDRLKSGVEEFDRVMGGGIVPGSVTLLAGDPGIGKSTLLLHILSKIGGLYIAGEESAEQVKLRAFRVGIKGENITIFSDTDVDAILQVLENTIQKDKKISNLVIVDSIQTITSSELNSMAGSVGQIRYSAEQLITVAKNRHIPIVIIGHVTKEGTIAGPKILEHMVDTVLYLEGERFQSARILRTLKNRFGAIEEVGIFEMGDIGLTEIKNPSKLFLSDRVENVPGSAVTVVMEGSRPLLLEIQALTVPTQLAIPRRVANGFDYNRLQLLIAILQKRMNVPLGSADVFVNVSGGFKIEEPGADLAVCLAILSSYHNLPLDPKIAAFGEVGLLGEIRAIGGGERRTNEAKRLGYGKIINSSNYNHISLLRIFLQKNTKTI
jgi:DNA repair protein RadA/Sms